MKKLKCLSNFKSGYTFLAAMVLGFVFLLSVSGVPSMVNSDGVYLELVDSNGLNATGSNINENFNFTVNNTNASYVSEINVSIPTAADGNATFSVDNTTIAITNSSWECLNVTSDGVGNITLIRCNTSPAYALLNGASLNISFNATTPVTLGNLYQWNVTVSNESGFEVSQNISFGVDGTPPQFSNFGTNGTYFTGDVLMWVQVDDKALNNQSVNIIVVNATDKNQQLGNPSDEDCTTPLGPDSWNCTASWSPSSAGEGNYSFNITAGDDWQSNWTNYTGWFVYDTTAPTLILNYPANNTWDADGDVEFNFTPYDALGCANCSVWVANSTGYNWILNDTNDAPVNNQKNNITVYGFSTDADEQVQYIWNVRCWDYSGKSSFASQNFTVNVGNRSNIIVESVTFDETEAPSANEFVTVNVTLRNNGTANVVENNTLITVYFGNNSNPKVNTLYSNGTVQVQNTSLPYGGIYSVLYEFNASSGDGVYYVLAEADSGTSEAEQNETDNTLMNSFSTFLNITVNSVAWSPLNATQNVTVTVTVLFNNGTGVTGLAIDDFIIYDRWNAPKDSGRTETDPLPNTTLGDFTIVGSGVYTFNYTVPGPQVYSESDDDEWYTLTYAEYGLHDINVEASLTGGTGNYTGNSSYTGTNNTYNLTAPYLWLDVTSFSETMTVGGEDTCRHTFSNEGNVPIPGGNISVESDDDPNGIIDYDFIGTAVDDSYIIAGVLAPGGNNLTEGDLVAEAAGTANLTVTGEYTYDGVVYSIEFINQVVVSAAGDDGNGDDDNGGTIGGIQYDCITDSDCDSDEECDSDFMCVEIDCDAGYYATGHTCKISPVYEIEIISYEDELSLNPGESVETNLSVNNTGNQNLTVIMSVDADIEGVDFNVTPLSQAVTVGESGHFTVRFIVSEDAAIGKHTINYKATTSSIAKDTKSFILIVQPQPDDIEEIKQSYQNLTAVVSQLLAEFNAIKGQLSGDNLTAMETKINATQTLFNSLKTSMKGEDYAQAYMYLEELNALIGSTMSLMEDLGVSGLSAGFWNAVMIWVVVAFVCVGAVGLLIYMMVPARGYALGKGYTPQGKPSIINKLKDTVLSLRGKMPGSKPTSAGQIVQKYKPAYSEGYDKLSSSFKPQPTGVASKMKKVFKKEK